MQWKWLLVVALVLTGFTAQPAKAEERFEISVAFPFDGVVRQSAWSRLDVTVVNGGGPFSGYIELSGENYRSESRRPTIRQELRVKSAETVQLAFDFPTDEMTGELELRIVEAGKVLQKQPVSVPIVDTQRLVGVVHAADSAFHFLNFHADQNGTGPTLLKKVKPESLPREVWLYDNLDILALGGEAVGRLDDAQVSAIKEWIRLGGVAVLSAGPDQHAAVDRFRDLLPLKRGESGVVDDLSELRRYIGDKDIPFPSIPVYDRNMPLFVAKPLGAGMLLFANFDVAAEPLASWQQSLLLWQKVLERHGASRILEENGSNGLIDRSLLVLSKYIPGIQTPIVGLMVAIWVVYLGLVGPVLYLVLKRLGRREWAWGIIPATALLLSLGVYQIGRPLVVEQDSSFAVNSIRIVDEQLAEVQSAATFVTVAGGDYEVETKKGYLSLPLKNENGRMQPYGIVRNGENGAEKTLVYQKVPYLSVIQAAAHGIRKDIGSFRSDLTVNGNHLQGMVKNETAFDLEDSFLIMGRQRFSLGPLKRGEETPVNIPIEPLLLPDRDQEKISRRETVEQSVKRMKNNLLDEMASERITLVGVSGNPLPIMQLRSDHISHYWNMISQTVPLRPNAQGKIVYPYGLIEPDMYEKNGEFGIYSRGLWELGKGNVTFALDVGNLSGSISRVTVPLDLAPFRPFQKEIFHAKTGEWKLLERDERVDLQSNVSEFINPDGKILIRFTNTSERRIYLPLPYVQVEGEEEKA